MKNVQVLYRAKRPLSVNGNIINKGEIINVREYHLVVGGISSITFTDKRANYLNVTAERFRLNFELEEIKYE